MGLLQLLANLKPSRDSALEVHDAGDSLEVQVTAPDVFEGEPSDQVPVDADRGVYAVMGKTKSGALDVARLSFRKDKGWTVNTVRSFLAEHGFDKAKAKPKPGDWRAGSEACPGIDAKAKVTEDQDWWVIHDLNVVARTGAFNGILRQPPVFDKSWRLYEGIPITHPHPAGLVEDMALVGGIVENVRKVKQGDGVLIVGDYRLAKRAVDGLQVNDSMIALNAETVRRVRAGLRVDNSQGYLWKGRDKAAGDPEGDYDSVMLEVVPNHLAILLEQEGACSWNAGCGVARLALEAFKARGRARGEALKTPPNVGADSGDATMPCDATCSNKPALEAAQREATTQKTSLDHANGVVKDVAAILGSDATCDSVKSAVVALKPKLERIAKLEAAEKTERATLAKECAKLAKGLGKEGSEEDILAQYGDSPLQILRDHASALRAVAKVAPKPKADAARTREGSDGEASADKRLNDDGSLKIAWGPNRVKAKGGN